MLVEVDRLQIPGPVLLQWDDELAARVVPGAGRLQGSAW